MSRQLDRALLVAFFLSGCAALGYELLWTQLLSLALGNETLGVYGVLAGFFGGMALGSAVLHDRARQSPDPVKLFVRLEVVAAAYALISPYVLYGLVDLLPPMLGQAAGDNDTPLALAISIAVAGLSLLPGTFCMGATLPALVEARRRAARGDVEGHGVGRLYAANTAGATAGVLLTVHVILPAVGLAIGAAVLTSIGVAAVVVAARWGRAHAERLKTPVEDDEVLQVDASKDPDAEVAREPWLILVVLGATGLVGVGLEVAAVQVLAQLMENTVYTFADILAVYLVGTAAGSALYARYAKKAIQGRPASVAAGLLVGLAVATALSASALAAAPDLMDAVAPEGSSYGAHLVAEMAAAAVVFGPPTLLMGATFTHLIGLVAPRGVGRAYAVNTLGSAIAPLVFGLWVIPDNGYRDTIFVIVYAYLFIFGVFTWFRRFSTRNQLIPIAAVVVLTMVVRPESLVLVGGDEGWKVLERRETPMGLVIVSEREDDESPRPLRRLQVGRHFRMGGALAFGERRMGHLPLLLKPQAESALFLGIGTGATLGAVTHSDLQHVDAVELVPAVLEMLPYFEGINEKVAQDERVDLHAADARRFVAATDRRYDLVVADLFHPARDGAGGLYAREHFEQIRAHMADGGVFAQWLPLYQLDEQTFDLIVRTFLEVFDEVHSFLGIYNVQTPAMVLVAKVGEQPLQIDLQQLSQSLSDPVYGQLLMQDPRDLLGAYLLDGDGLRELVGEGPLNTDLNPRVLLRAPRSAYEDDDDRGWTNLSRVLQARTALPQDLIAGEDPAQVTAMREQAEQFAAALQHYLQGESIRVQSAREGNPRVIPEAAVQAYLKAYEVTPEFPPARGMLYTAAANDPKLAPVVFPAMLQRTPDEPRVYEAYLRALQQLGDERTFEQVRQEARRRFGR